MGVRHSIGTAVAVATGLVAALGAGVVVGRVTGPPWGGPSDSPTGGPGLALVNADLTRASSCEALLDSYVDRALELVGPYGWGGGPVIVFDALGAAEAAAPVPGTSRAATSRATAGETGTNVQEAGVDEPDVVKVVGHLLLRVRDDRLTTYDVSGDAPRELSVLALEGISDAEILVSGSRVVALGSGEGEVRTRVVTVDLADPSAPIVVGTQDFDSELTAARLHGEVARLVLRTGLPELDFTHPGPREGEQRALEANRRLVRETTLADWLPDTLVDGRREPALDCPDVAIPAETESPLGTTTVLALDAGATTLAGATAVATDATTSYFSTDRFYLAAGTPPLGPWGCLDRCLVPDVIGGGATHLYAFALAGSTTTYVASGEVEGTVRDRWSMDVVDGTLRVAVGQSNLTGNFNSVLVLGEEGSTLTEIGRVDKLGVDEEIKAVRWFDDLALVVTFRQVDPLYAIDLTDPRAPRLVGELKIPGFSEYLHPLGGMRMLGVGQDAGPDGGVRGAQAALFDVSDLAAPRRLDTVAYPRGSQAGAGVDPRQFTWLPERRTALTVVSQGWPGRTGWVSVLTLDEGRLTNRMVEVEYGEEVDQVRLVPLASGRVVLVTGDEVSFFELSVPPAPGDGPA